MAGRSGISASYNVLCIKEAVLEPYFRVCGMLKDETGCCDGMGYLLL